MVKKISYWTAVGQFFEMLESQLEEELQIRSTEVEQPLSDYQDALNSVSSELQVRSCPAHTTIVPGEVRKTSSCPMAAFSSPAGPDTAVSPQTTSDVQLNEATIRMIRFLEIFPKRSNLSTLDEISSLRTEYTLFEMMDGFFSIPPTPNQRDTASLVSMREELLKLESRQPSLFEKLGGLFVESPEPTWCPLPRNPPVEDLFEEDTISSGLSVWSTRPQTFYCPSCKAWNSLDNPSVPQLPVFVKSPLDSLKIYDNYKCSTLSGEIADDELTDVVFYAPSPAPSPVPSSQSTSSDDTSKYVLSITNISSESDVVPLDPLDRLVAAESVETSLREKIEMQTEIIEKQNAIIAAFTELGVLSKKLSDVTNA